MQLDDDAAPVARVGDHMSRDFLTVRVDGELADAIDRIVASGLRQVAVVDPHGGFEGLLSAETIRTRWRTRIGRRPPVVGHLLTGPPVRLQPSDSLRTAASLMLSHSVDAVGVCEADGPLVGVLTWANIVAMVAGRGRP